MRRAVLMLLIVSTVSSCGFQMRSSELLPDTVDAIYISNTKDTAFSKALHNALRLRGVTLSSSRQIANAVITVNKDVSDQRILSVAVTEGPEEYEVFQVINFTYSLNNKNLIENKELTLTRDYTYDRNDMLGKRQEYASLREALAIEMADTVIRQIRFVK